MYKIGIDMGGTFTDFIAVGKDRVKTIKVPSNKEEPIFTVMNGLGQLASSFEMTLEEFLPRVNRFVHGNTVAINALIQRKGVKTALIATEGFRDCLEMRRSKLSNQWDFFASIPRVLVPRYLRFGLPERVDYSGKIIRELDFNHLQSIVDHLREEKVESVAVCLLFSFCNPTHERKVKEYIEKSLPEVFVTLSSEVAPKVGEYERTSTTVLNGYLTPLVSTYLTELSSDLESKGLKSRIQLVQNNGGLSDSSLAKEFGVKGLFSGPAAGSSGARALGNQMKESDLILVDMGGTSFDVSLVTDYTIKIMPESEVEGYPVNLPLVDINSIGIGGGSIAKIDEGKRLCVGPESAEAFPGPACYDRGGEEPTITDAALVLGFIEAEDFSGALTKVRKDLAIESIKRELGMPLEITVEAAAYAVYKIAAAKMVDAVHLMTVQKGYDPREFVLCSVGGASPLFASSIAKDLGIKKVVVPAFGEVFCAQGMLESSIKIDLIQSVVLELTKENIMEVNKVLEELMAKGQSYLGRQGVIKDQRRFQFHFEMRYVDQHHQLDVPFIGELINEESLEDLLEEFHRLHEKNYGYFESTQECSLIDVRLEGYEEAPFESLQVEGRGIQQETPLTYRDVCWENDLNYHPIPVYDSRNLQVGKVVVGPALIKKEYTTVFVSPSFEAWADGSRNIILQCKEGNAE